jgi:hypothetical protein
MVGYGRLWSAMVGYGRLWSAMVGILIVADDLTQYGWHRLSHSPWLWPLHRAHHSAHRAGEQPYPSNGASPPQPAATNRNKMIPRWQPAKACFQHGTQHLNDALKGPLSCKDRFQAVCPHRWHTPLHLRRNLRRHFCRKCRASHKTSGTKGTGPSHHVRMVGVIRGLTR